MPDMAIFDIRQWLRQSTSTSRSAYDRGKSYVRVRLRSTSVAQTSCVALLWQQSLREPKPPRLGWGA